MPSERNWDKWNTASFGEAALEERHQAGPSNRQVQIRVLVEANKEQKC